MVKAALWQNAYQREDGSTGRFKTASISNLYRDETAPEGQQWVESNSYTLEDLYRLQGVVQAAIDQINPVTTKRG